MNSKLRKILACIIVIIVIAGWYITACGIGSLQSIKDVMKFGLDINGGVYVVMEAETDATGTELDTIMEQTRAVMEKRVNAMGISEATVSIEGNKRIRIEIPGVEDVQDAIANIGKTAQLRFLLADGTEVLTGEDVKDAGVNTDNEHGGYLIQLEFTSEGAAKFEEATRKAANGEIKSTNAGIDDRAIIIMLDDEIVTAPVAEETISSTSCVITSTHGYSIKEATGTAALIRGGALPVGLTEITSSVQTATIGADALQKSIVAGIVGLLLVFALMIIAYGLLGLMADIALALYVLIVLWVMAGIGAVLTLPGIAALILSIGMAVDANVIIFARVREELGRGKSTRVAVSEGFRHAVVTVLDAQITTLIAAVVLYLIGSSTVKGFAITLMIGIIVSIFTAIVITQILIGLLAESKKFSAKKFFGVNEDGSSRTVIKKAFEFIKNRRIFYIISVVVIVLGLVLGLARGFNYGIDFTGGTMMQIDMGQTVDTAEVEDLLKDYDLNPTLVLSGDNREQLIIKTTKALENAERLEIVSTLGEKYGISEDNILASEEFGPTVGRELKSNAFRSVVIAAIGMLIYIILRFKSWKMGVSAVACLAHDVLFVLAMYGLFRFTINNPFIAGILTVVGYSINDTIVVFDRVRENRSLYKRRSLAENLDASVNETLPRSIMTSVTTLVAMLPLMIMVSTSIREFVIPLVIGVLCGTYSSVFLSSPLFYELSKNENVSKYSKATGKTAEKKK
ncbi:MAG: protein translocase subunit SecF [Firmicutes bacterium]|nr:protein translocase subunit SecF [Bacillota bacterium]